MTFQVNASTQLAIFQREQAAEVQRRNWTNIPDASMRRQFQMLTNIGPSALKDQAKVEEVTSSCTRWFFFSRLFLLT